MRVLGLPLAGGTAGPALGWRRGVSTQCPPVPPSSELCCKACVGFYHWVMVAVTGGVGVVAALALCSLMLWPIHLRHREWQVHGEGRGPGVTGPPMGRVGVWPSPTPHSPSGPACRGPGGETLSPPCSGCEALELTLAQGCPGS